MIKRTVAAVFLISTSALAVEVDLMPIKDGRMMLDTDSVGTKDGFAYAKAWMYTEGRRVVWYYVVGGCSKGFGMMTHGQDAEHSQTFYWTRQGTKNGDLAATIICSLAP